MDVAFLALAESMVGWVEERFGRLAAIATAGAMIVTPVVALVAAFAWFAY